MKNVTSVLCFVILFTFVLRSSTDKMHKIKKSFKLDDESFVKADGHYYPPNIVKSVHSDIPDAPQIKISFADDDEDDDADATISIDNDNTDESDDDDDDSSIKKKKLPKSKFQDIHSFL